MKMFQDAADRQWNLRITIGAVERVKEEIDGGPDLLALAEGEPSLATRLEIEPALLCHVIFALVKPQADAMQVTDKAFCEAVDAKTFTEAAAAFWGELCDFFQMLGRSDLVRLIEAQHQVLEKLNLRNRAQVQVNLEHALATVPALQNPSREKSEAGNTSGGSPESADSTPDQ